MNKCLAMALLSALTFACHEKSESKKTEKPEEEILALSPASTSVDDLLSIFDRVNGHNETLEERPTSVSPMNFLTSLHPKLASLAGKETSIGQYAFIPLKKIPDELRDYLLSSTKEDSQHTGYALLMRSTWVELFKLQDDGFQIGILNTKPTGRISGIYSHQRKQVGLDVLAPEGTLVHEKRHADQYAAIESVRTGKIEGLNSECYAYLSSMFAEVDANNVELATWLHTMDRVDFEQDWYTDRERALNEEEPVFYHFAQGFEVTLSYPVKKAVLVRYNPHCPTEVQEFAAKIEERMEMARKPRNLGIVASNLSWNRQDTLRGWKSYFKFCSIDAKALSEATTDKNCAGDKERTLWLLGEAKKSAEIFNTRLAVEVESRPKALSEIYQSAPFFQEFCKEMPGFKFYATCPAN